MSEGTSVDLTVGSTFTEAIGQIGSALNTTFTHTPQSNSFAKALTPTESTVENQTTATVVAFIYLGVIILVSTIGNILVLYTLVYRLHWTSFTNAFLASLSVSDLLAGGVYLPMKLIVKHKGTTFAGPVPCLASGILQTALAIVSTLMVTCVAIDRYKILASVPRAVGTSKRTAWLLVVLSWVVGFLLAVPYQSLVYTGGASFGMSITNSSRFVHRCTFLFHTTRPLYNNNLVPHSGGSSIITRSSTYELVVLALCFLLPVVVMLYCCARLVRMLRRNQNDANSVRPASALGAAHVWFQGEMRTAGTATVMVCVHIATRGPYILMVFFSMVTGVSLTLLADIAATWIFCLSYAANPVIYAVRNPNFSSVLHLSKRRSTQYKLNERPANNTERASQCLESHTASSAITDAIASNGQYLPTSTPYDYRQAWSVSSRVPSPVIIGNITDRDENNEKKIYAAFTKFKYYDDFPVAGITLDISA